MLGVVWRGNVRGCLVVACGLWSVLRRDRLYRRVFFDDTMTAGSMLDRDEGCEVSGLVCRGGQSV